MTGTIEWNDPAVILPPLSGLRSQRTVLVAHVDPVDGPTVEPGRFYFGKFHDPDEGFAFVDVVRWAMMPDFPDAG